MAASLAYVADSQHEALATMRRCLPRWLGPGLAGYRRADGGLHHPRDTSEYTELLCRSCETALHCGREIGQRRNRSMVNQPRITGDHGDRVGDI